MQDYTASMCQAETSSNDVTMTDRRDNKNYTVRYLDGNCWMTQNLRFAGTTLTSTNSNVASTYTDSNPLRITWGSLSGSGSYAQAQYLDTGDINKGYMYNYAGASAMSIATTVDNTNPAVYSICPAGWRIPEIEELLSLSSAIADDLSVFRIAGNGWIRNGTIHSQGAAYYWSSTAISGTYRYNVYGDKLQRNNNARSDGNSLRCIRAS